MGARRAPVEMAAAEAKAATPAAPSQHKKPPLFWQNPIRCGGVALDRTSLLPPPLPLSSF